MLPLVSYTLAIEYVLSIELYTQNSINNHVLSQTQQQK